MNADKKDVINLFQYITNNANDVMSLKDYMSLLIKNQKKDDDLNCNVITLTKNQLVHQNFTKAINHNLFNKLKVDKNTVFLCNDKNLFFSQKQALTLLQNYKLIKKQGYDLVFREPLKDSSQNIISDNNRFVGIEMDKRGMLLTFGEILQINTKLLQCANKINNYSNNHNLSPFEKYLVCFNYVSNIQYSTDYFDMSHSYTGTILKNQGCCVGKSQYLRILLKLCNINSCCATMMMSKEMEELTYHFFKKYRNDLSFFDDKNNPINIEEWRYFYSNEVQNINELDIQTCNDHCINLIYIDDDKYNLHGIFTCDTCNSMLKYMPIKDRNSLKNIFNFSTYALFSNGGEFDAFLSEIKFNMLPKNEIKKIENEFFTFTQKAIKEYLNDLTSTMKYDDEDKKLQLFISEIGRCRNDYKIRQLFDKYRFEETKFGKIINELYDKVLSQKDNIFNLTSIACENRVALEGCPFAYEMPTILYENAKSKAYDVCEDLFSGNNVETDEELDY